MERVGAVIIGGDFMGLGVIRSLSEEGVPVFLIEHEWSISRYSKYIKRRVINRTLLKNELFADYMIKLAIKKNIKGWVLYPNNDELVKLLSINKDKLSEYYKNPVPPWETVRKFYNKDEGYDIAEKLFIPIPKRYKGCKLEDILSENVVYPIVLKPCSKEIYFPVTRKKAIRVNDRESLIEEYGKMAEIINPTDIVVQELIEGGPKNLYSYVAFFDGERVVSGMSAIRKRQHPMDFGQATTFAVSVHMPELEYMATKLLKEIGHYGLAEVEFMKDDKDGVIKFLEINGRQWGWHTLAKGAGINLPFYLFQHMTGGKIEKIPTPQIGVKWIRLITDIPTVCKELASGRMSFEEYFDSLKGKREFAVLSLKDPIPFIMEYLMIPYLWWKRGF